MNDAIRIADEPLHSPVAVALIGALDADEVAPGRGAFVVARRAGDVVGCGAVRILEPGVAEVKRMYVVPDRRGEGVGGTVLAALVSRARDLGAARLVLETGSQQPEAIALYERNGFHRIPCFGPYAGATNSVCMERLLGSDDHGAGAVVR